MQLQESGEMYLETILVLTKKNNAVRSLDVAEYRNYSKPSVSRAVKLLKDGGYITVDEISTQGLNLLEKIANQKITRNTKRYKKREQILKRFSIRFKIHSLNHY